MKISNTGSGKYCFNCYLAVFQHNNSFKVWVNIHKIWGNMTIIDQKKS